MLHLIICYLWDFTRIFAASLDDLTISQVMIIILAFGLRRLGPDVWENFTM